MKTSSAKGKGRRLQQLVAKAIQDHFNLDELDVRSTTMGDSGEDIRLSSAALKKFPYAVECKNVEKINIWACWEQTCEHVRKMDRAGIQPLLVFKRNRSQVLAVVDFNHLMNIIHHASIPVYTCENGKVFPIKDREDM